MATILIVDDDEMERLLDRTILEDVGHELYFAKDGADALSIFRERDFDVVITDLNMPRIDGLKLIRQIREIDATAEVIVVSGVGPGRLEQAQDLGAIDTLAKPVDRDELIEAVANAVKRKEADDWA